MFTHPTIAFVGLYAVRPELQGHGIGLSIWKRAMEHVGSLNAGLYAVPEHLAMYRDRAGFKIPDERLLAIYHSDEKSKINTDLLVPTIRGIKVEPITSEWCQRVIDFDSDVHGYNRRKLLPHVFNGKCTYLISGLIDSTLNWIIYLRDRKRKSIKNEGFHGKLLQSPNRLRLSPWMSRMARFKDMAVFVRTILEEP